MNKTLIIVAAVIFAIIVAGNVFGKTIVKVAEAELIPPVTETVVYEHYFIDD